MSRLYDHVIREWDGTTAAVDAETVYPRYGSGPNVRMSYFKGPTHVVSMKYFKSILLYIKNPNAI